MQDGSVSLPENEQAVSYSITRNTGNRTASGTETESDKKASRIIDRPTVAVKKSKDTEPSKTTVISKRAPDSSKSSGPKLKSSVNGSTGLSKPSFKSSTTSSTRKSTSSTTGPILGHTRAAPSSGGSGDEKRNTLTSASRRASVTQVSLQQSSTKLETLAEKRGISAGYVRKPVTSVNSANVKQILRSTSTTNRLTNSTKKPSDVVTRATAPALNSDIKKTLPSQGCQSTTKPVTRTSSTLLKEVDVLKVELSNRETINEELKKQIVIFKERDDKLTKKLEEETDRFITVETSLRNEHLAAVQELQCEHNKELQRLRDEFQKSHTTRALAQEALAKDTSSSNLIGSPENVDTHMQKLLDDATYSNITSSDYLVEAEVSETGNCDLLKDTSALSKQLNHEELKKLYSIQQPSAEVQTNSTSEEYDKKNELDQERSGFSRPHSPISEAQNTNDPRLSEMKSIIASLECRIKNATEQQEALEKKHQRSMIDIEQLLREEHQTAIRDLKQEFNNNLSQEISKIESLREKETAELIEKHTNRKKLLEAELDQARANTIEMEATLEQRLKTQARESLEKVTLLQGEINGMRSEIETKSSSLMKSSEIIRDLNEKCESLVNRIKETDEKVEKLTAELNDSVARCSADSRELHIARDELAQMKAQIAAQKQMKLTLDADEKSKDELCEKIKAELEAASRKLEEKKSEIAQLGKKHSQEIGDLSSVYKKKIEILKDKLSHEKAIEDLKATYEERLGDYENILERNEIMVQKLKQNYEDQIGSLVNKNAELEAEVKSLNSDIKRVITETSDQVSRDLIITHTKELQDLQVSHEKVISALKHDHARILSENSTTIENLRSVEATQKNKILELSAKLSKSEDELKLVQDDLEQEIRSKATAMSDLVREHTLEKETLKNEFLSLRMQQQQDCISKDDECLAKKRAYEQAKEDLERQEAGLKSHCLELEEQIKVVNEEADRKIIIAESRAKEAEACKKRKEAEIAEVSS